jgi:hypothetical protein
MALMYLAISSTLHWILSGQTLCLTVLLAWLREIRIMHALLFGPWGMNLRMGLIMQLCLVKHSSLCGFSFFYSFASNCKILLGWIRGRDSTRLIHYEGGGSRTSSTDIVCPMYMRIWDIVKISNDPSEARPLILCEYSYCALTHQLYFICLFSSYQLG